MSNLLKSLPAPQSGASGPVGKRNAVAGSEQTVVSSGSVPVPLQVAAATAALHTSGAPALLPTMHSHSHTGVRSRPTKLVALPPVAFDEAEKLLQMSDPVTVAMLLTKWLVGSAVARITTAASGHNVALQQPPPDAIFNDEKRLQAILAFSIKRVFQMSTAGSPMEDGSGAVGFDSIPGIASDVAAAVEWDAVTGGADRQGLEATTDIEEGLGAEFAHLPPHKALQRVLNGMFAAVLLLAATLHPEVFSSASTATDGDDDEASGHGGGILSLPSEITEASNTLALEAAVKCSLLCQSAHSAYSALSASGAPSAKDQEDVALLFRLLTATGDGIASTLCSAIGKTASSASATARFVVSINSAKQQLAQAVGSSSTEGVASGQASAEGSVVNSSILRDLLARRDASYSSLQAAAASLDTAKALAVPRGAGVGARQDEEEDPVGVLIATASKLSIGAHGATGAAAKAAEATQKRRLDELKAEVNKATAPLQDSLREVQQRHKGYLHRREQLLRELEKLDNKTRESEKEAMLLTRQIEDTAARFKPRLQQIETTLGLSGKVLRLQEAAQQAENAIHELKAASVEASLKPLLSSAASATSTTSSAGSSPLAAVSAAALRTLCQALAVHTKNEATLLSALSRRRNGIISELETLAAEASKYRAVNLTSLADQQDRRIAALRQDVQQDDASIGHVRENSLKGLGEAVKTINSFLAALTTATSTAATAPAAVGRPSLASVTGGATAVSSSPIVTLGHQLSGQDLSDLAYVVGETSAACQSILAAGGGTTSSTSEEEEEAAVNEDLRRLYLQLTQAAQRKGASVPPQGSVDVAKEIMANAVSKAASASSSGSAAGSPSLSSSSPWKATATQSASAADKPAAAKKATSAGTLAAAGKSSGAATEAAPAVVAPASAPPQSAKKGSKKQPALSSLLTASALKAGKEAISSHPSISSFGVTTAAAPPPSTQLAMKLPAPPSSFPAAAAASQVAEPASSPEAAPRPAQSGSISGSAANSPAVNPWKKGKKAAE
jgi:hypothetical protein